MNDRKSKISNGYRVVRSLDVRIDIIDIVVTINTKYVEIIIID